MEYILDNILPLIITSFFFTLGVLGTFLPILPSCFFIWLGIFIHKMWVPQESVPWTIFWIMTGLVILSQIIDWACTYWGTKRFGGSWKGGVGAILGIIIGPFILSPIIGFIVGPIIGAIAGELLGGRNFSSATKAGLGTLIGGLVAFIIKLGITCFMISTFYASLFI